MGRASEVPARLAASSLRATARLRWLWMWEHCRARACSHAGRPLQARVAHAGQSPDGGRTREVLAWPTSPAFQVTTVPPTPPRGRSSKLSREALCMAVALDTSPGQHKAKPCTARVLLAAAMARRDRNAVPAWVCRTPCKVGPGVTDSELPHLHTALPAMSTSTASRAEHGRPPARSMTGTSMDPPGSRASPAVVKVYVAPRRPTLTPSSGTSVGTSHAAPSASLRSRRGPSHGTCPQLVRRSVAWMTSPLHMAMLPSGAPAVSGR